MNASQRDRLQFWVAISFFVILLAVGFGGIDALIFRVFDPAQGALLGEESIGSASDRDLILRWLALLAIVIGGLAVYSGIVIATMVIWPMSLARVLRRVLSREELTDVFAPFKRTPVAGPMFDRRLRRLLGPDTTGEG